MSSKLIPSIKKAGKKNPRTGPAESLFARGQAALRRWGRRLLLEELEPRLAPATLTYNYVPDWATDHGLAIPAGANLTLKVVDNPPGQPSGTYLQILDNDNGAHHETLLNQDITVNINGGPLSDTLTVDFSYTGALTTHYGITVNFKKDDSAIPEVPLLISNSVTIAGSGPLYKPNAFSLNSDAPITISGALTADDGTTPGTPDDGDITLTATAKDEKGLPGGKDLFYSGDAEITMGAGGDLKGHDVTLHAESTLKIEPENIQFSVVIAKFAVGLSDAGVTITGGSITATHDLKVEAVSTITSTLDTSAGDSSQSDSNTDAAIASAILKGDPKVAVSGGTLHADHDAFLTATNTINATTTADGTTGQAGAAVGVTLLVGYLLFGIEEIGVEIEDPFGVDENDLPLDRLCATIERNLLEMLPADPAQADGDRPLAA